MMDDRTPIRAAALAAMAARRGNPVLFTYYSRHLGERRRAFAEAYYARMPAPVLPDVDGPAALACLGAAMKNGGLL